MKIGFGDLVVEASPNPNVYVTASQIVDTTGVAPPASIGGPINSPIPMGAMIKVTGTRDASDPALVTLSAMNTIDLPGVQAYYLGLDSNLAPAIPGSEPGQVDHGVLWVTGTNTGNVVVVDTALSKYNQLLAVPIAASLGGVSVNASSLDPAIRLAYVAGKSLQNVTTFGPGTPPDTAPVIWSASTTTFTVGSPGTFKVMATGSPKPTLSYEGTPPSGMTFVDNGDGTATLAGTPALGTEGSYPFTFTAANGVVPNAIQNFTLTVVPGTAPAITSANTTTFTVGSAGSFTVTATGPPTPTLSFVGTLPDGLTFVDNGNGTATLAGTPAAGTQSSYTLTITAANGVLPNATQVFTLTVAPGTAPAITSAITTTFTVGSAGSFTVTATGSPTPALSYWGTLPSGVTFTDNGNSTATLAGTPATAGSYPFTITASNGVLPDATQGFTLTVNAAPATAPAITSASTTTFTVGSAGSFTVTATGSPTPTLSYWGTLPSGVTFTPSSNGTATLAGTPGAAGGYPFTITAANGILPNATQYFTLTVNAAPQTPPAVTAHPTSQTVTAGQTATFTSAASGSPTPTVQWQLNTGSTWSNITGATSTNYTTPATTTAMSGYQYRAVFTNSAGSATSNAATLTVDPPPVAPSITTQPANQTVTAGQTATFSVVATGTAPLSYQWRKNGADIPGASTASYTTPATTTADSGSTFSVVVQNSAGSVTSNNATLTVNPAPTAPAVTTHPSNQTVTAGQTATFTSAASGNPTPTVQWQLNTGAGWSNITGAISTNYTTPATTTAMNGYQYRAVFTNSAGSATSNAATLTVNPQAVPLTIVTTSLPNGTVGQSYSAQLEAQGGTQPYRWRVTGNLPRGLTLSGSGAISGTPGRAGTYNFTVRVTDSASHSASKGFRVTIAR
jgi:Putative Ig domain/Immunoglobulin domain/Immunoglobulin I-set domain